MLFSSGEGSTSKPHEDDQTSSMDHKSSATRSPGPLTPVTFTSPSTEALETENESKGEIDLPQDMPDYLRPKLGGHQMIPLSKTSPGSRAATDSTASRSPDSCGRNCTHSTSIYGDRYQTFYSPPASMLSIPLSLSDAGTERDEVAYSSPGKRDARPTLEDNPNNQSTAQFVLNLVNHQRNQFSESSSSSGALNSSIGAEKDGSLNAPIMNIVGSPNDEALESLYGRGGIEQLTSYPQQTIIEQELKIGLLSLLSIKRFECMLSKPVTRTIFRDWLIRTDTRENLLGTISSNKHVLMLDRWTEESRINQLCKETQQKAAEVMHRYHEVDEHGKISSCTPEPDDQAAILELVQLATSAEVLTTSRRQLLECLYAESFKNFLTSKLLEVTRMKLRSDLNEDTCEGLGDSFVVTNPRLRDNPIVMVSPGFTAMTGYGSESIIGKNCRFLQGPGTSPEAVRRMKLNLRQGLPFVELLMNYKVDGTPFYCLLNVIPLYDETGYLSYFIGGQVNVTDELRRNEALSMISETSLSTQALCPDDFKPPGVSPTSYAKNNRTCVELRGSINQSSHGHTAAEEENSTAIPRLTKGSRLNWIAAKIKTERKKRDLSFQRLEHRGADENANLHCSLSIFQSTYSQLIFFKQSDRSILFVTPEALNFLGFPTTTIQETYASPLLHHDFIDLVDNCKNYQKIPCSKRSLKKIISSQASATFECEMCFSHVLPEKNLNPLRGRRKAQSLDPNVMHLTPLKDQSGTSSTYVAILT